MHTLYEQVVNVCHISKHDLVYTWIMSESVERFSVLIWTDLFDPMMKRSFVFLSLFFLPLVLPVIDLAAAIVYLMIPSKSF